MTNKKSIKISGGCHCKQIQFSALVRVKKPLLSCNCSICTMTGFVHLIVPHNDFKLAKGMDNLTTYQFNSKQAKHLFCKSCGIKSFYQPRSHPDSWSVNINCLKNFNIKEWDTVNFNGRNWQSAIQKLND